MIKNIKSDKINIKTIKNFTNRYIPQLSGIKFISKPLPKPNAVDM